MKQVSIKFSQTHLSTLVDRVAAGETVIITKAGNPIAKMIPVERASTAPRNRFGFMKGHATFPVEQAVFDTLA